MTRHIFSDDYNPEAFAFLPEFQLRLLALLVRDPKWLRGHRRAADHRYWEHGVHRNLAQLILKHFDAYKRAPDLVEVAEATDAFLGTSRDQEALREQYIDVIQALFEGAQGSPELLSAKFLEFSKHQAIKAAHIRSIGLLPEQKWEEMEALHKEAFAIDLADDKCGESYRALYEGVMRTKFELQRRPVPTGIERLDKILGGGIGRCEVGAWEGGTGLGKTMALIECSAGAAVAGYRVFYAGLEDPKWKLVERLNRRLSGMTRAEIEADPDKACKLVAQLLALTKGDVEFEWFPPRTTKFVELTDAVDRNEQKNGKAIDLVVIDYLNKVAAPDARKKDYEASAALSELAAGWATETSKAVWTGLQITGDGSKSKTVDHTHAYGGRQQTHAMRVIIGMSQTPQEEANKPFPVCRLFVGKSTDHESRTAIRCYLDKGRGRIIPAEDDAPAKLAVPTVLPAAAAPTITKP